MPIISSISGTYGFGRSPQTAPTPGITIYPPLGTKKFWSFTTDGTFAFEANSITHAGNCYVITPNTNFTVNVKIWGAGGGSGNASITSYRTSSVFGYTSFGAQVQPTLSTYGAAGAGGYVYGKIMFQAGQPYTIFTGGAGKAVTINLTTSSSNRGGQGGAASGILLGNVFAASSSINSIAIAGGGAGAPLELPNNDYGYYLAGAGGGVDGQAPISSKNVSVSYNNSTNGTLLSSSDPTVGTSGLPTAFGGNFITHYCGGVANTSTAATPAGFGVGGGGAGGALPAGGGGDYGISGKGFVDSDQIELATSTGMYSITSNYSDSSRGTAGDSDCGGRVVFYLDEYRISSITATGGTETTVPIPGYELAYKYHTFTTNGKFVVNAASKTDTIDVFVVGAGGSTPVQGLYGAGGGGGVAFKSDLSISTGTYNVEVGTTRTGNNATYNFNGKASAFYTNNLATQGFPDSYIKLINSFSGTIKYINVAGDNTDGLTILTGYTSFESAYSKNINNRDLIVFVVIAGTYNETVTSEVKLSFLNPTPIYDANLPRIFVCAPNKVTINWTPTPASVNVPGASPMCQLMHPMSAVYGAIFDRSGYKQSSTTPSNLSDLAFFNVTTVANGGSPTLSIFRGSLYNCVFKDSVGDWGLFGTSPDINLMNFKIENCTFDTLSNDIPLATGGLRTSSINLVDCIFKKSITHSVPNLINVAQNATIAAKYVVAAHVDKGVYAGEYGWGGAITKPITVAKLIAIVAPGGGAGAINPFLELAQHAGGSGGGSLSTYSAPKSPAIIPNKGVNANFSYYGHPGSTLGGGGGAGYPAVGADGGVGIEFPTNSNVYYGCGGSTNIAQYGFTLSGNKFISVDFSSNASAFRVMRNNSTVEAWVKIINSSNATTNFNIFNLTHKDTTGVIENAYSLDWDTTTQKFSFTVKAVDYGTGGERDKYSQLTKTTTSTYPTNTWYHIAQVFVSNSLGNTSLSLSTLYINGVSVTMVSSPVNPFDQWFLYMHDISSPQTTVQIGKTLPSGVIAPTGQIAGVHVINGTAKYTKNFTPPTSVFVPIANTSLLIQGYISKDSDRSKNRFPITLTDISSELGVSPFTASANEVIKDIYQLAPCDVGRGAGGNNAIGTAGTVMVRYVVPGPYTLPAVPSNNNIIAYGGNTIKITSTYKEHVFTENGNFDIAIMSASGYFDVIVVGGGGSGGITYPTGSSTPANVSGGAGGEVNYKRVLIPTVIRINVEVGTFTNGLPVNPSRAASPGASGTYSKFGTLHIAAGGAGGSENNTSIINGRDGSLIVDGLFSDNTTYYGGEGGGRLTGSTMVGISSKGGRGGGGGGGINTGSNIRAVGSDGQLNTGGGGGASNIEPGAAGGSGIVIIRYPVFL